MTRTEEFLSVLQPVGPEFLSRFTHHDDLYLSQSIDQVLKSQSMQYQRPGLSLATFWRHPSQEQIYFSVLSLPHHSPGHHWDLSGRSRVHLHCSIPPAGCLSGPGRVSAEERRLAAEEGSYSLKTWLRKISRGWASSSTGPQPRPVSTVLLSYLSLPTGRAWLVGYSWILWSINPQSQPSILPFPVEDRRLAAEEGLFSQKTWPRKTPRRQVSSSPGPCLAFWWRVSSCLRLRLPSPEVTSTLAEEDTKTGVRGGSWWTPHCRARVSTIRGFLNWDLRWAWEPEPEPEPSPERRGGGL